METESTSQASGKLRQFIATIIVNLMSLSYGISVGWTSPIMPQLRSSHPPVGEKPMSEEQISWIASLLPIGGLLTIPFCGILSEKIGRKYFALLTTLQLIVSWLLVTFAQNYHHLLAARLFVGIAAAMIIFIVPLYVSEIATEDIRGFLGSLFIFFLNIGVLFAYSAGAFLSYRLFSILSLFIPIVAFLAILALIPESPIHLVRRNRQVQAHKSLMFFRGNNQVLVDEELMKLMQTLSTSSEGSSRSRELSISYLVKDKATRKGLFISFGLLAGRQLSGILAIMSYAETIFKLAGSSLSAETASIIIAIIQLIGSYMSTMLVERAGRRPLALISCIGMTISHSLVGLFFYLQQNHYNVNSISWLPIVALSSFIITFCLGIGVVAIVVTSELFSLDASSLASNVCFGFFFVIGFIAIKSFNFLMQFFGPHGCFFILASFCAASFVFSYLFLPETKGRKREDIVDELAGIDHDKIDDVNETAEIKTLTNAEPV